MSVRVASFARVPRAGKLRSRVPRSFDGNELDAVRNWLIPTDDFVGVSSEAIESLMQCVVENDDLAWLVLPTDGFRL